MELQNVYGHLHNRVFRLYQVVSTSVALFFGLILPSSLSISHL